MTALTQRKRAGSRTTQPVSRASLSALPVDDLIVRPVTDSPVRTFPVHRGEFWTARQRQMHPVHYSISYRASFKPELPDFFIQRYLDGQGATVLDPFGGRGTTTLQANLLGYAGIHNDISPVSVFISSARSEIPTIERMARRLEELNLSERRGRSWTAEERDRFSPFFHADTFREILSLREAYLENSDDPELRYIMLTALSRLHGHSEGFFSVYSFPQISIMPDAQRRNNEKRGIVPEYRNVAQRILRKARRDMGRAIPGHFAKAAGGNRYRQGDARYLKSVPTGSVDLIVTSPPFLDKVDYAKDNWMRAWFINAEEEVASLPMAIFTSPEGWLAFMKQAIHEMGRVLRPGGRAVIEVGEVVQGGRTVFLEELMVSLFPMNIVEGRGGLSLLKVEELFLHTQSFTKLANCWDVKNNEKGTNTNRCLVLRKEPAGASPVSLRTIRPGQRERRNSVQIL